MSNPIDRVNLLRPEDLLYLEFGFNNLTLNSDDKKAPFLFRTNPDDEAHIIVQFQPQHIEEEAFFEAETEADTDPLKPPPVRARLAGKSRLAFRIPETMAAIPFTVENLLNWDQFELSLTPTALPPNPEFDNPDDRPDLVEPTATETALELPYRLIISPNRTAAWIHANDPVTHDGRTELWHTRLGSKDEVDGSITEDDSDSRTVRAIWSPDYDPVTPPVKGADLEFLTSLTPNDRHQFVRLTSDFGITPVDDIFWEPQPVDVDRLMLTSLGGWLDSLGFWDMDTDLRIAEGLDIESWRHIAGQGQDQYVRVVTLGYVYPTHHLVAEIKITERKILSVNDDGNNYGAFLRQYKYIDFRRPFQSYQPDTYEFERREFNSASLRSTIKVTPKLDKSPEPGDPDFITAGTYWIKVGGQPFPFHFIGKDLADQTAELSMGLIFIPLSEIDPDDPTIIDTVRAAYNAAPEDWRRIVVPNQKMAYAEKNPDKDGDTVLTTEALFFDTKSPKPGPAANDLFFVPTLDSAEVRVPAVEQIAGSQGAQAIRLYEKYVSGLENKANIFAELITPPNLAVSAEKAGGISTPNLDVSGLSQHLGPVGGVLDDLAQGSFDPTDFFNVEAQLLGGISLADIITAFSSSDPFDDDQFPKMVTKVSPEPPAVPETITTTLTWHPTVKSFSVFVTVDDPPTNRKTDLTIVAKAEQQLSANTEPSFTVDGKLAHFIIDFLGIIEIAFDELSFKSTENKKLDVNAKIREEDGIKFKGPLRFLEELRKFIPSDGFIDPPFLDLSPVGVKVGFTQGLPPLAVGVFSLQNVFVGAALHLPFDGSAARFRFNFSERHDPFIVTVGIFGGGGFFALALGLDGMEMIEAAIEFGGNAALDIGVASGGIYVMAGVYFKYEIKEIDGKEVDSVQLTGYLRCGGYLNILGLISVSVEFYLGFSYIEEGGNPKIFGRAEVKVKVEVLFFSKTVTLSIERKFAGTSKDPTFRQMLKADDWAYYGEAFA